MTPSIISFGEMRYFWLRFSTFKGISGLTGGRIEVGFGKGVGNSTFLSMDDFPNYIVPKVRLFHLKIFFHSLEN